MARYLIDTDDGCTFVAGDPEQSHDCVGTARAEADRTLGAMALDASSGGGHHVLQAIVRNEIGQKIYVATMTFTGEWQNLSDD